MINYKMVFSYDGSRYKGWQKLGDGALTIQGILEQTISEMLDYSVEIHGSGRTDAGVHARGQVANMKVPFSLRDDFVQKMNEILPDDIRIVSVERVSGSFHARYSATKKTYCYYVDTNEKQKVFTRKYACHYPEILNLDFMREAAEYLLGEHDFSSFTDDKSEKDKVRNIYSIQIHEKENVFTFEYYGNGFLQHMIRIITGTLLEVGCGKKCVKEIPEILKQKERAKAGFMVPGRGLFLENVEYD